jgi:hypothetical protein
MTAKSGNVLTITRAQNGTTARAWVAGSSIGRYFTAADQTAIQNNITKLNEEKAEKVSSPTSGDFAGLDSGGNLTDSGKKAADFAAQDHTHAGKADKVSSPTSGDFAGLDSSGNLTDSGKKAADFAVQDHTHAGKADKVSSPTSGDFAGLDSSGNLTDSGKKAADFADASHSHSGYAQVLIFSSVAVAASAWASDSTYADFPYAATITLTGVTSSYVPEVNFDCTNAASGNFAPVALSGSGTIKVYAAEKPTAAITIQSITCIKAV